MARVTVKDLREQTKAAYKALTEYRRNAMGTYDVWNMRQAYEWAAKYTLKLRAESDIIQFTPAFHQLVINFAEVGEIYYHAKDHGVESAMLLKLKRY